MESEFVDLTRSNKKADENLKFEREASKAKDEIIKCQDAKILEIEVSFCRHLLYIFT